MHHRESAERAAQQAAEAVELGARSMGLAMDSSALGRVAAHWLRLQAVVAELDALALLAHDQLAPEFVPGAEASP